MAKRKPWDILGKVDDIAKKSGEGINTGPKKKKIEPKVLTNEKPSTLRHLSALDDDYHSRPGAKGRYDDGKQKLDVNLPINTASQEVKDRMAKLRSMRKK